MVFPSTTSTQPIFSHWQRLGLHHQVANSTRRLISSSRPVLLPSSTAIPVLPRTSGSSRLRPRSNPDPRLILPLASKKLLFTIFTTTTTTTTTKTSAISKSSTASALRRRPYDRLSATSLTIVVKPQQRTMSNLKRKASSLIDADSKKPKANGGGISSFFSAASKPTGNGSAAFPPAAAGAASVKFSKDKWVAGLTAEQRELLKLEIDTLHESWLAHLKDDIISREFLELKKFLQRETAAGHKWFPPKEDVYSWSRHTPFHEVKVVIVGQDPYHNVNQAHGLAFSVRPPTPAPPSLRNMYIALKKDYPGFRELPNRGGLLTPWADRGVLMLNTCLTVRAHEANSHSNHGWEKFTQKVIDLVAQKRTRGVVFIAWGTSAGKRVVKIDKARHLVLTGVHPSPLSASRGFFDCGHFRAANDWLVTRYGDDGEIDWALVPGNTTKTARRGARDGVKAAAAGYETKGKDEVCGKGDGEGEQETEGSAAAAAAAAAAAEDRAGAKGTEAKTATVEATRTTVKVEVAKANTKKEAEIDEDDVDSEDEAAMYEALQLAEQMRN